MASSNDPDNTPALPMCVCRGSPAFLMALCRCPRSWGVQERMDQGMTVFRAGQLTAALVHFTDAAALMPLRSPVRLVVSLTSPIPNGRRVVWVHAVTS